MKNIYKRTVCLLILILIALTPLTAYAFESGKVLEQGAVGSDVMNIQNRLRDLGYLNFRATGKFSDMTVIAVRHFQTQNGLEVTGNIDKTTVDKMFSADVIKSKINPAVKKVSGPAYSGAVKQRGALSSWEEITTKFGAGTTVEVMDFNTGKTFKVKRVGGKNLAYVTTVSTDDYDTYRSTFRGDTWEHRPVLVTINGMVYAASLFGMPTYTTSADNEGGMKGHTFMYFNTSKTDVFSLGDEEHIVAINKVAKQ